MHKRTILSAYIVMALNGHAFAAGAPAESSAQLPTLSASSAQTECPADTSTLSSAEKANLPAGCLKAESSTFLERQWEWVVGGVAAAAGIGLAAASGGGGGGGGDSSPTPSGDDTTTYANGVVWNKTQKTISAQGATWTYKDNGNGTYTLTNAANGNTVQMTAWFVDAKGNAVLSGTTADNKQKWKFSNSGLTVADVANWHEGDGQVVNIDGSSGSGQGQSGTYVDGEGAKVDNTGDTSVTGGGTGGGTGTKVGGNDAEINNQGKTDVSGQGSTGTDITGNGTKVDNTGDTSATDGGTGIKIDGKDTSVNNTGDTTVSGQGSTGALVTGDGASVKNDGKKTIADGGTGTRIAGGGAVVDNSGDTDVQDEGSTAVAIDGSGAKVTQSGKMTVSDGARGIVISGERAAVTNDGAIQVKDQGSQGVVINGSDATFTNKKDLDVNLNATGVAIAGDRATVNLGGNLNVTAQKNAEGVQQGATGLNLAGNNGTVTLSGNVNVTKELGEVGPDGVESQGTLTGIRVDGDGNSVKLEGTLNAELAHSTGTSQNMALYGIAVSGQNNAVEINGGVNINYTASDKIYNNLAVLTGVDVQGQGNVITIGGNSSLSSIAFNGARAMFATASQGGKVVLREDSVLNMSLTESQPTLSTYYDYYAPLYATGSGSTIENFGTINGDLNASVISVDSGASAVNYGKIAIKPGAADSATANYGKPAVLVADGQTSAITNAGEISITSNVPLNGSNGERATVPLAWSSNTIYALLAKNNASASNLEGATINLSGTALYGLASVVGTVTNGGTINLDGFMPTLDSEGNVTSKSYVAPDLSNLVMGSNLGAGVIVGTGTASYAPNANASGVNTGTINVNNEGFGMLALYGGTVTNQGTINLTADEGVAKSGAEGSPQLVAMGAVGNGIAINDRTGKINVNVGFGQAFYTSGQGQVVNYGEICTGGACQSSTDYNPTDPAVIDAYADGSTLAAAGGELTLTKNGLINGHVTNAGTTSGSILTLRSSDAALDNLSGATLASGVDLRAGSLTNGGTVSGAVNMSGGTLTNQEGGTISTRVINGNGAINNAGTMNHGVKLTGSSTLNNTGNMALGNSVEAKNAGMVEVNNTSVLINTGAITLDNNRNALHINQSGVIDNKGAMTSTASSNPGTVNIYGGAGMFKNSGNVNVTGVNSMVAGSGNAGTAGAFFWNEKDGAVNFNNGNGKAVNFTGSNYVAQNDGVMNIVGSNAVAMYGDYNSQLVNNGTINLGAAGTSDTGLIGMQLGAKATESAVVENNGTININASDSYAFSNLSSTGRVVNNGVVNFAAGISGSALIAPASGSTAVEGVNGNLEDKSEKHYTTYTLPAAANSLKGYVVGTSADGSAGILKASNASLQGVTVNTGFTSGTAATRVTFDNVVQGSNLTDVDAIRSTSVVWNAQGSTNSSGNVNVTMTKNAYGEVSGDAGLSSVAGALDAGYTNNELYGSLNVGTRAELNKALKQISGSQATTAFREARVLSNRFTMLSEAAPEVANGLSFNAIARGDSRAELGNNTQFDMLTLRRSLTLTDSQSLALEYGIARLDGNGSQSAGDNGVTGGYSQFFGLKHELGFGNGFSWSNALRYDEHNLENSRSVSYSGVNKNATSDVKQQYLELQSVGGKTFEFAKGLNVKPYAGVKMRHTIDGSYQERNAGDFNLNMNGGTETALDGIVGLKLNYLGDNGWGASATLEGGPNLSYAKSQRSATLAGAAGQRFNLDDDQKGGGVNSMATVGLKYSDKGKNSTVQLDAYQWKEDSISDKGFMLNVKKSF